MDIRKNIQFLLIFAAKTGIIYKTASAVSLPKSVSRSFSIGNIIAAIVGSGSTRSGAFRMGQVSGNQRRKIGQSTEVVDIRTTRKVHRASENRYNGAVATLLLLYRCWQPGLACFERVQRQNIPDDEYRGNPKNGYRPESMGSFPTCTLILLCKKASM